VPLGGRSSTRSGLHSRCRPLRFDGLTRIVWPLAWSRALARSVTWLEIEHVSAGRSRAAAAVLHTSPGCLCFRWFGANPNLAVDPDYQSPFPFTGILHTVTIDLSGDLIVHGESEMHLAMMRQ
jgi:arylsulfatase